MNKVKLVGYVIAADEDLENIVAELPRHIELTLQEEDCLAFEVTQDFKNRNKFNVYEEFTDQEAFEKHQARARSTRWAEVSKNLERHYHTQEGF